MDFEAEGRERADRPDRPTFIVIDLADFVIRCANDVGCLFDELEMISEDYPGYIPIFKVSNGRP